MKFQSMQQITTKKTKPKTQLKVFKKNLVNIDKSKNEISVWNNGRGIPI